MKTNLAFLLWLQGKRKSRDLYYCNIESEQEWNRKGTERGGLEGKIRVRKKQENNVKEEN